jgi:hypothetical protein
MSGQAASCFHWEPNGRKEYGRIKIILSRFVNNSHLAVTLGLLVGNMFVQLPHLQGGFITLVTNAKEEFVFHCLTPGIS